MHLSKDSLEARVWGWPTTSESVADPVTCLLINQCTRVRPVPVPVLSTALLPTMPWASGGQQVTSLNTQPFFCQRPPALAESSIRYNKLLSELKPLEILWSQSPRSCFSSWGGSCIKYSFGTQNYEVYECPCSIMNLGLVFFFHRLIVDSKHGGGKISNVKIISASRSCKYLCEACLLCAVDSRWAVPVCIGFSMLL